MSTGNNYRNQPPHTQDALSNRSEIGGQFLLPFRSWPKSLINRIPKLGFSGLSLGKKGSKSYGSHMNVLENPKDSVIFDFAQEDITEPPPNIGWLAQLASALRNKRPDLSTPKTSQNMVQYPEELHSSLLELAGQAAVQAVQKELLKPEEFPEVLMPYQTRPPVQPKSNLIAAKNSARSWGKLLTQFSRPASSELFSTEMEDPFLGDPSILKPLGIGQQIQSLSPSSQTSTPNEIHHQHRIYHYHYIHNPSARNFVEYESNQSPS